MKSTKTDLQSEGVSLNKASVLMAGLGDYCAIARPDHWFKNVFMLIGFMLAIFYRPGLFFDNPLPVLRDLAWAFLATSLAASSNYVINEILDAPTDRKHPEKRHRPIASGRINIRLAYVQWLLLGASALLMAYSVNFPFFLCVLALWLMGLIYNVRPIRSKELAYLDVLTESINNPIRLMLGWFVLLHAAVPPVSLMVSYWMVGAFFMASKRFAEYRSIDDPVTAAAYRASFKYYDENRLLISMFFYVTSASLFLGVFIIRYHLELILSVPLIAGFFSAYMRVVLKRDSAAQAPEKLFRETGLMIYLLCCLTAFVLLMFLRFPALYDLFNVVPSEFPTLWEI